MKEMTIEAKTENLPVVTAWIEKALEEIDCPMKDQAQIDVAIDELFGNIAHYAYAPGTGEATVRFTFDTDTRTVSISFVDGGIPFDPLSQAAPDINAPAEARAVGGLGIYLVRKTMDRVDYRYADGKNILTIQKRI